jgi:hypothetical protein
MTGPVPVRGTFSQQLRAYCLVRQMEALDINL